MKRFLIALFSACLFSGLSAQGVYINEIDYDQPGADIAEFIELVGPDGASLTGYTIELVNGNNGTVYNTVDLTGFSIPNDNVNGHGFFVIGPAAGVANVDYTPTDWVSDELQNGAPDGILLKLNGVVVDGFSYEGALTNNPDFTAGMAISAFEDNNAPNLSVGRMTLGFDPNNQEQFFAPAGAEPSPGEINTAHGQVIGGDPSPAITNLTRTPRIPEENENTTVSADVTDNSDVTLVELRYMVNSGAMQSIAMANTSGDTYTADIPASAYNNADRVEYWVYAEDDIQQSTESLHFKFFVGTAPISAVHPVDANGVLLYDGYDVRVRGVATAETGIFSATNLDVYIQDATGGVNIFQFGLTGGFTITRGNDYTVVGTVDQFNGKAEVITQDYNTDIVDNGPGTLPGSVVMTIAQFLANPETYEGMLIAIQDVTNTGGGDPWPAAGSNANVQISDDGGASLLTLRIDSDTNIDGSPEPAWPVSVRGIFIQFDNASPFLEGYQITPRDLDDIDISVGIEPVGSGEVAKAFKLHSNFPNPFNPSTTLRFDIPAAKGRSAEIRLTIYNALGQKVNTLVNESLPAGSYDVQWNGRAQNGSAAPSGVYFAELSMNNSQRQVVKMMLMK